MKSLRSSCVEARKDGMKLVCPGKVTTPPCLPTRTEVCAGCAASCKKQEKSSKLTDYNAVIQEQIAGGIVEHAPHTVEGQREFYIPHKSVVRETAESTKLRIVYDTSARAWRGAPSLNECLNTGPSLQNK